MFRELDKKILKSSILQTMHNQELHELIQEHDEHDEESLCNSIADTFRLMPITMRSNYRRRTDSISNKINEKIAWNAWMMM